MLGALAAALALAAMLLTSGCGGAASAPVAGSVIAVAERDFHISAPTHLRAGPVVLRVHNVGPDQHELIVARLTGSGLPLRRDGLTIDEEALTRDEPGSLEPGQPGVTRDLAINLAPGRYVLFCNMEGHYLGGMHHEIVVSG